MIDLRTSRADEIVSMLAERFSVEEIAHALQISIAYVERVERWRKTLSANAALARRIDQARRTPNSIVMAAKSRC